MTQNSNMSFCHNSKFCFFIYLIIGIKCQQNKENQKMCIQLDKYHMMVCVKYFNTINNFISFAQVNKKCKEVLSMFFYNPLPIKNTKIFDNMTYQILYNSNDTTVPHVEKFINFKVDYEQYLNDKKFNLKFKKVCLGSSSFTKRLNELLQKDPKYDIPKEVNFLRKSCFENQINLTEVVLTNSIKIILQYCFDNCQKLKNISLPLSVKKIYYFFSKFIMLNSLIFRGSNKITQFVPFRFQEVVNKECSNVTLENNDLQRLLSLELARNIDGNMVSCSIPLKVNSLHQQAFMNCYFLSNIRLSDNITSLGEACFMGCDSLVSLILPQKLVELQNCCFQNCTKLTRVKVPDTVTYIGDNSFENCALKTFDFPSQTNRVSKSCFRNCMKLESITFKNSTHKISYCCAKGATNLTQIFVQNTNENAQTFKDEGYFVKQLLINGGMQNLFYCFDRSNFKEYKSLYPAYTRSGEIVKLVLKNLEKLKRKCFTDCPLEYIDLDGNIVTIPRMCFTLNMLTSIKLGDRKNY
ncbi:hypothetical protein EIN_285480 [Entamoeba invadens IP1]|uniref:Leucine rich repeat containing protein BspA family protein n=1 Tax=Entamoeba invadens IP1 TaxID=370355 RepID=A0A0A1U4X2_ENTIV|nr:hypothetical protein EIN_285480 [Entamoeba invadens IP1]ELP89322.1 hypothetical protein EIN_285480 [Entamoeba invadens IP1]|eukprot:XP_004256093.1 hypothetical protein EIN_285480 [Entamoeba invadens IP1]